MPSEPLTVLFADNHCLAVLKPAGLLTMGDETGDVSLHGLACRYVQEKYHKPGKVFLGVRRRLESPVSGVVLFARASKAAARLSEQFRERTVIKTYHALVEGQVSATQGERVSWLLKDPRTNTVRECDAKVPDAQRSVLTFKRLELYRNQTLLEVNLQTGRSHQIRVQLAALGHPLVGDVRYGSKSRLGHYLCLHAASLQFAHPISKELITVTAPTPLKTWRAS